MAIASMIVARMSRQASVVELSACRRHMFSGSRVPVHSVMTSVPSGPLASASTSSRRSPDARTCGSGWAMLNVPETAAISRSRMRAAVRTRSTRSAGMLSGIGASPATERLNCVASRPWARTASSVASTDGRAKVFAKMPSRMIR